jgi:hypothetical protein
MASPAPALPVLRCSTPVQAHGALLGQDLAQPRLALLLGVQAPGLLAVLRLRLLRQWWARQLQQVPKLLDAAGAQPLALCQCYKTKKLADVMELPQSSQEARDQAKPCT